MGKWPDKKAKIQIVNKIIAAANAYKAKLVGKSFLYYFEGRYIEVVYRVKDFAHLTGAGTSLSANDFYKEAIKGRLQDTQIFFSSRHPHSLCVRKLSHLLQLARLTDSPILILEDVQTRTTTFQFGLTELKCTLCLDHDLDDSGVPKSEMFIVKSLRDEDCFKRSTNAFEVNLIFSKENNVKLYDCCTFNDGKVKIDDLPESVKNKLSPSCMAAT